MAVKKASKRKSSASTITKRQAAARKRQKPKGKVVSGVSGYRWVKK